MILTAGLSIFITDYTLLFFEKLYRYNNRKVSLNALFSDPKIKQCKLHESPEHVRANQPLSKKKHDSMNAELAILIEDK